MGRPSITPHPPSPAPDGGADTGAAGPSARRARVVALEYQGTSVHVGLDAEGLERPSEGLAALTAVVSDQDFAAAPVSLGDTVAVGWDADAAHRLSA